MDLMPTQRLHRVGPPKDLFGAGNPASPRAPWLCVPTSQWVCLCLHNFFRLASSTSAGRLTTFSAR